MKSHPIEAPNKSERVTLIGIRTEIEWQLAFLAAQHAEGGRRNFLTYETPAGDVTLAVERRGNDVTVRRKGNASAIVTDALQTTLK